MQFKSSPVPVPGLSNVPPHTLGLTNVVDLSVGMHATCALLDTGVLKCWGLNDNGQIGNGTISLNVLTPTQVDFP